MATQPAAPATMTLDRSDGSATMDLYRAALGPVHTDSYLRAFTRFDAAGHSGLSWNWTAALLTLNWMLFRRLWLAALAYVGILAGTLLLLLGIGRLLFQLPDTSLWALAGLGLLLAIVVPGAYGNAWLYAACNKAMAQALTASATMEEACALLRKRTNGRPRLIGLAVGNVLLAGAVGALAWSLPGAVLHGGTVESASAAATSGLAAASATASAPGAPSRSSQGLVQPAPVAAPAVAVAASAAAPVIAASQPSAAASMPAHAASVPVAVASAPAPAPTKAELRAKAMEAKKEKLEKAKEAKAAKEAEAKAAKEAKAANEPKAKPVAKVPAAAASAPATTTTDQYLINVGLFTDPNNARNAYAKLQDAGVPALIKELKSSKGPQTRVRAGPFDSEAEAERAAEKIRGLHLDAVVIKP